jgi:hypothetical protein
MTCPVAPADDLCEHDEGPARKAATSSMERTMDITGGRDEYVITKALAYAIGSIQSQTRDRQDWSDLRDMVTVFLARVPDPEVQKIFADSVERRTGYRPRFMDWKDDDPKVGPVE